MKTYALTECLLTVQGEGFHAGRRAVLLRFSGCNAWNGKPEDRSKGAAACRAWCDTAFDPRMRRTAAEIVAKVKELWGPVKDTTQPFVFLTGGEPALQVDTELVDALQNEGIGVAIETNGSKSLSALLWITCSPKRGLPVQIKHADELKVVLPGVHPDEEAQFGAWTLAELNALRERLGVPRDRCYVVPQDPLVDLALVSATHLTTRWSFPTPGAVTQFKRGLEACLRVLHEDPSWRLGVQAHKVWDLP